MELAEWHYAPPVLFYPRINTTSDPPLAVHRRTLAWGEAFNYVETENRVTLLRGPIKLASAWLKKSVRLEGLQPQPVTVILGRFFHKCSAREYACDRLKIAAISCAITEFPLPQYLPLDPVPGISSRFGTEDAQRKTVSYR